MLIAHYDEDAGKVVAHEVESIEAFTQGEMLEQYSYVDRLVAWGPCTEEELIAATTWAMMVYEESTYGIAASYEEVEAAEGSPYNGFEDVWDTLAELEEEDEETGDSYHAEHLARYKYQGEVVDSFSKAVGWYQGYLQYW